MEVPDAGVTIEPETVARLADIPNIVGVKDHTAYRDWLSESKRHGTYPGGKGSSPGL